MDTTVKAGIARVLLFQKGKLWFWHQYCISTYPYMLLDLAEYNLWVLTTNIEQNNNNKNNNNKKQPPPQKKNKKNNNQPTNQKQKQKKPAHTQSVRQWNARVQIVFFIYIKNSYHEYDYVIEFIIIFGWVETYKTHCVGSTHCEISSDV